MLFNMSLSEDTSRINAEGCLCSISHFHPQSTLVRLDTLRNLYLQTNFPKLTYIRSATVLDDGGGLTLTAPEAADGECCLKNLLRCRLPAPQGDA